MFENIGGKIKALAQTICWIGIILSIIVTLILLITAANTYDGEALVLPAFIFLIIGTLSSWIGSFFMYGFGELIEKVTEIAENTSEPFHTNLSNIKSINPKKVKSTSSQVYQKPKNSTPTLGEWQCKKCGSQNSATAFYCKDCGNYK